MKNKRWVDTLIDKDYRITYEHPDIIKCSKCEHNYGDNMCSNIYSYPTMPEGFGCKNGRINKEYKSDIKYSIWDKIKCILGFHKERFIGQSQPFSQEILIKCDCCGKYCLWHRGINCEAWFKFKNKTKYLSKSCLEMIDKYKL